MRRRFLTTRWDVAPEGLESFSVQEAICKDPSILLSEIETYAKGSSESHRTICIPNLPASIDSRESLRLLVCRLLNIANRNSDHCIATNIRKKEATLLSSEDAESLLSLQDTQIRDEIGYLVSITSAADCTDTLVSPYKLYIGNIESTLGLAQFNRIMNVFGETVSTRYHSRGFAFVEFRDRNIHRDVIELLNGRNLGGRELVVSLAQEGRAVGIRRGVDLDTLIWAAEVAEALPGKTFFILNALDEWTYAKEKVLCEFEKLLESLEGVKIEISHDFRLKVTCEDVNVAKELYEEFAGLSFLGKELSTMWCKN